MICSENKSLNFVETIRNLASLHNDAPRIERLIAAFPENFVQYGLNLTKSCVKSLLGSGLGFYSYLYTRMYSQAIAPQIFKMESLRESFNSLSLGLNPSETMRMRQFILIAPKLNTSDHGAFQDYYSPELKDLIAKLDHEIIDQYDYQFD